MERPEGEARRAYGIVAIATLAYTSLMFVWFSLPAYLSTIIGEVGLTSTQAGALVGAVPATYIPIALFSGVVVDRVGPGRTLAAGTAIFGLAQIGRSTASTFPSLLVFTVLIGSGATAVTFGLPKLVSFLFPPDRTGLPSSIYLVGAAAGSAAAFAIGRPLLGPILGGWRPLFFWSGLVATIYAVVWFAVARQTGVDDRTSEQESSFSVASIRRDLALILSHRELQLVVVIGTMYLLVTHGLQGWLPTILESRGFSPDRAGQTTGLFVGAIAVGTFVVPAIADRFDARRVALLSCGVFIFVGVSGLVSNSGSALLFGAVTVSGLGVGGISPLLRAIPPELDGIGPKLTGTAVGFIFAVGEIGGFLGPMLVGTLHGTTRSFVPGLAILATAGLVVAVAGETLRRIPIRL